MLHTKWLDSYRDLLTHVGIIALVAALLVVLIRLIGLRLIHRSTGRAGPLRKALYRSAHSPLLALIMLCAAYLIGGLINGQIHASVLSQVLDPSLHVGILVVLAWAGWNLIEIYPLIRHPHGHGLDPMIYDLAGKVARLGLLAIIGLMILRTLHFPIDSLLTVGGVAGIAIGFAAQGLVSNLFGAVVIYLNQPFKIGEWIVLPSLNISGTVEHIGWWSTRLRGFDTYPYYVPNHVFNTSVVETPPRMQARRIEQTLPVRYSDVERLPAILAELRAYIGNHSGIDHNQSQMVYFTNYGTHSLDILIYCFAATVQWGESLAIQEDVLLNASRIIRRHGGQLALPVTRVQMQMTQPEEGADGQRVATQA